MYDGSIKIDTKVDNSGFGTGINTMKSVAARGSAAIASSLAVITAGIVAGGTAAVGVGASFEAAMDKVSAISGATGNDLLLLSDKAKEMGATTKFSASESAEALQYMAMAGWDTASMLEGISGIMSLSAADGLDLATTSDIVTDALTAFGLQASDSSHFADVLAKASSSANTNVSMLGESFKYVAPLAGTMGYSVEDVSVALGLMANASVKGSMAGTSLKTALANLSSPTASMKEVMDKYSISMTNAEGNSLSLIDVIKQLREKFGKLSESEQTAAASTLFGKEAMSGMLAIINASDSDFTKLVDNINNADGAAASMADTMQDNLQGQITIFKSSLEGLGIEIYEGMQEPLKEAAIEAQGYVNRLTEAFTDGGLSGMIEEAGNIFGELATKAAEYAPEMVEAAIDFLNSFIDGISANSDKLIEAAKKIVSTIVDNLIKLLPSEVQAPVREAVNNIKKSFENGGLRTAINTVKNIISNLGKVVSNVAKVTVPLLGKALDFLTRNTKTLVVAATALFTAYKAYTIFKAVTAAIQAHTAAVTAEKLAEAAATGAITLKQIAVGLLTGQIGVATAAQYAWNLAMTMNPIGIVVAAVAALAAGLVALCLTMGDSNDKTKELEEAQERLKELNLKLGESYEEIGSEFSEFVNQIDSAGSIFDNFNEKILISDEKKQEISDNMDSVQSEITEICSLAAEERRKLTGGEIERLDELFQKMHELADQELAIEQAKQGVVTTQAEALNNAAGLSLDEYTQRAQKLANTAEETRIAVIDKAYEQYTEEVALLNQRLETEEGFSKKEYDQQVAAAESKYQTAIESANKEAGDTLAVLEKGYLNKADLMRSYNETLKEIQKDEEDENELHNQKLKDIDEWYNKQRKEILAAGYNDKTEGAKLGSLVNEKARKVQEEDVRHDNELEESRNKQNKILGDKNYQNQLAGFLALEGLYETYTGKTGKSAEYIVDAFYEPMRNMDKETYEAFAQAVQGGIEGLESKESTLFWKASNIAGTVLNIFRRVFDEHSPSKKFEKIFGYTIEGGEQGLDGEAPKLYRQADTIGDTFTKRMRDRVNTDGLLSKLKDGVAESKALVSQALTAKVIHSVDMNTADNNRKFVIKGDIHTRMDIDGREVAVATAPYMSEEIAWRGEYA